MTIASDEKPLGTPAPGSQTPGSIPGGQTPASPPPRSARETRGSNGKRPGTGWGWLLLCMVMGLLLGLLIAGGGMYAMFTKTVIPDLITKLQEAGKKPPEPMLVRVDEVKQRTVADQQLVTGYIQPVRQSTIASEESARVLVAPPDIGTPIHRGDILAKLDTTLLDTQRAIALADIAEAKALLAEQQATLDQTNNLRKRYEELSRSGSVSQTELDQAVRDQQVATAKIETAKATIAARQADLDQINERLGKMIVRAPFDGTITQKLTELGQWLSPGSPVAQLVDWSTVDARINIPESIIDTIKMQGPPSPETAPGNIPPSTPGSAPTGATRSSGSGSHPVQIIITVPSLGKNFTGYLYRVVPSGDPSARTFPALVRLDNADGQLRPGMTVTANLTTGRKINALLVARDAMQITPTGPRVIVDRNGTAVIVPVNILFTVGDHFVVHGNLQPGDLVVTEGNERLTAGTHLKIIGGAN